MKIKFHQITLFFISTLRAGTKRRLEESETASHCFYEVQNMNCKCKKNPFYCYSISNSEKNIFDQTTSIIKHDEKEYFNRIHDSAYFSEPIKNKISRFNHFNEEFQNFVFSSNPCKFKQPITTLNTRNNFFYFSKQDEISEPLKKELNNWTPISIDFDSLNELLDGKQHDSYIQEQNFKNEKDIETVSNSSGSNIGKNEIQKLQNELFEDTTISSYNNAVKFLKTSIKKYLQPTEIQCKTNLNLELIKLKAFIEAYISNNIPNSYSSRHIRRLKNISEAWEIFDKHKTSEIQYWNVFDNSSNVKFINKLKNMLITFDKNSKFCQENYDMFLSEFEPQIYNRSLFFKLHCNIENLTLNQKTLIFYLEAMKLYKYIYDMPELLSVIGLFSFKSCGYITSTIYLINLIAENVGNLREYRTFILCLICKMFEVFNVNMFGFFMLPHYELVCDNDYHDLSFFLWELNGKKRYDIRSRNSVTSNCIIKDKIFIKAIFYTYLYQHLFYIKYSNIEEEEINSFISFVCKAKISEDCVGCLFKEYLGKF